MDLDVSLDRVSLVGKCSDPYELQSWIERKMHEAICHPDGDGVVSRGRELAQVRGAIDGSHWVKRRWQLDGVNVELRLKVPTEHHLSIERWNTLEGDEAAYRLEWNPNKAHAGSLVWFMESPRATRYDVALDYEGVDLGDWTLSRPRSKSATFQDASGNMNGMQLGATKSERFLVAYDKGIELGRDDLLMMRVEMRQRILPDKEALPAKLFDGLEVIKREIPSTVTLDEAAKLALRIYAPEHYKRLHWNTRKKYDELALEHCGCLAPSPVEVYRKRRDDLREWADILKNGDPDKVVPIAQVYRKCGSPADATSEASN